MNKRKLDPNAVATTHTKGAPTHQERIILDLVATGWRNAEIAQRLHLSPYTIKSHVSNLLTKFDCANRTQLAVKWEGIKRDRDHREQIGRLQASAKEIAQAAQMRDAIYRSAGVTNPRS